MYIDIYRFRGTLPHTIIGRSYKMFNYSLVTDSQTTEWIELDGVDVELVLSQHKEERGEERVIDHKEVLETLDVMENTILNMRDGDEKKVQCNSTGVTVVVASHAVSEGNNFWLRLFIKTVYRNSMYSRVGMYR